MTDVPLKFNLPDNPEFDPNIVSTIVQYDDGISVIDYSYQYWHVSDMILTCQSSQSCDNETWQPTQRAYFNVNTDALTGFSQLYFKSVINIGNEPTSYAQRIGRDGRLIQAFYFLFPDEEVAADEDYGAMFNA